MTYPFMRKLAPRATASPEAVTSGPPPAAPGARAEAAPSSDATAPSSDAARRMTAGMQDCYDKLRNNPGATAGELEKRYDDPNLHKRLSELYRAGFINKGSKRHCKVSKRNVDTWSAKPSAN